MVSRLDLDFVLDVAHTIVKPLECRPMRVVAYARYTNGPRY